jgi:hypothetical protein
MRKKHGFTPKYINVQAPTAMMNRHRHSRCHYKRNSGSAPVGTNNPPHWRACGATKPQVARRRPLQQQRWPQGRRCCDRALSLHLGPRPHSRGEDKLSKPKSRRPGARMVAVISSATRTSLAATTSAPTTVAVCPPADPHSGPPGRANTDLRAGASYQSKGRTAQEHERRPSSARRLGRSPDARCATAAHTMGR